ncbi:putative nuclease HARBI1 [Ornithodoros turicata]|uniref:putative nuclease HARBI1 n=1 Tax=Ornithodoros turicata TaxID=34597 RepID=UPI003138C8EE
MAWTYPARRKITTALLLRRLRRRRKRTMYIREIFDKQPYIGQYHNLVQELRQVDPEYHFNRSFDRLLGLVYRLLHPPNHRIPIYPAERLAVTLRFLATGSSMQDTAINYCMHVSAVSNILSETLAAIWDCLSPLVLKPPRTAEWEKIRQVYSSRWNFPNVIGIIDGKHFAIRCPDKSGSDFFNYKGFYSIVLLAVPDAECRFILVDVGAQGRVSDGACFNECAIKEHFERGTLGLPSSACRWPVCMVGDAAFPLRPYLMRPYSRGNLSETKKYSTTGCREQDGALRTHLGSWCQGGAHFCLLSPERRSSLLTW